MTPKFETELCKNLKKIEKIWFHLPPGDLAVFQSFENVIKYIIQMILQLNQTVTWLRLILLLQRNERFDPKHVLEIMIKQVNNLTDYNLR